MLRKLKHMPKNKTLRQNLVPLLLVTAKQNIVYFVSNITDAQLVCMCVFLCICVCACVCACVCVCVCVCVWRGLHERGEPPLSKSYIFVNSVGFVQFSRKTNLLVLQILCSRFWMNLPCPLKLLVESLH